MEPEAVKRRQAGRSRLCGHLQERGGLSVTPPSAPGSAVALRARFGEMMDCWLEVHCPGCKSKTLLPIKMLGRRYGNDVPIGALLNRLPCKRCSIKIARFALAKSG